ncbi:MAG: DNA translocase FtsK [Deltaproteobacteria bacterium]|nr:DNA translocase FtsK [Deltaproteobacteria bacterium]
MPRDWARLLQHPLVISEANRETISGKGSLQSLDLRDSKTLHACFSQDRGSLVAVYKSARNISGIWDDNFEEALKVESVTEEVARELKDLWGSFKSSYAQALSDFIEHGINSSTLTEQCEKYSALLDYICRNAKGDTNRNKLLKPLLQIGASQITGGNPTIIITPWHPLRLFALVNKAKQISVLLRSLLSKEGAYVEDSRLFFREIEKELEHPYYPEVVLGWDENEPHILSCTDSYLDYSLHEKPLATDDGTNDTNENPVETAKVVLDLIKRYLSLYPHERANLSTVLFNCDSSRLPQAIVSKVAELHEDEEDMRCEVILRHTDKEKLSNIYEKIVGSDGEDIDSYIASEATADFMARLRIGIMADQAPPPADEDGPPTDIVFLQDVIARHAKIEWYAEDAKFIDAAKLVPARWSRRKASAKDDMKSVVYLASPAQCKEGWSFITAITTFRKGDWNQDSEKRLLPARQLDFNDTKTASIFKEIHQLGSWVVNYDELLDKRQLLNQNVHVVRYKQTTTQGRNLLISSTASLGLLKSMLISRIKNLTLDLDNKQCRKLAEKFIKDANNISGDIVLRAAKRGRNASELIGVVLSKFMIKEELNGSLLGWYFLDDYAEWLGQKEEQIADILALSPEKASDGKLKLSVIVSEAKYIDAQSLATKRKESQKQLRDTVNRINNAIFSSPTRLDKSLWLSRFSDLIMNGVQFPANSSVELSDWRHAIREGDCEVFVRGYSHVFVSSPTDCPECSECVQVAELKNGYQEIFSRAKLRELVLAYHNNEPAIEIRKKNADENIWAKVKFVTPTKAKKSAKETNSEDKVKKLQASNVHTDATTKAIVNNDKTKHFSETAISNTHNDNREKGVVCDEEDMQWFANTKSTCKLALQNFQLRSKLIDSESRLTPNCALLKFEGSSQLTVDQVLKRQKEFLTSYGLDVTSVRPEAGFVSISIARPKRQILMLEDVLRAWKPESKNLPCELLIGIKEENNSILTLSPKRNAPHTLVAGSTGSGKSILLQNIILSIAVANKSDDVEVKIIDPKRVSFNKFKSLPHVKGEIIKDMCDAADFLNSLLEEMKKRYTILEKHEVEDIYELKEKANVTLPIIWVLHDEFALWMLDKGYRDTVEMVVNQLSVAARAAGIFLIFAAQRPDNNVFPMQLRANLGNRLVLKVDSPGTSEIALGEKNLGAEKLLGNGHIIAKLEGETDVIYAQVPFVGSARVDELIEKLKV